MKWFAGCFLGLSVLVSGTVGLAVASAAEENTAEEAAPEPTMAEKVRAATETVQEALRCEAAGANADRNELLKSALDAVPYCSHARWHSGYVQENREWLRYDQIAEQSEEDAKLAEYLDQRRESSETVEEQLALARWCNGNGLEDQARAHATAALQTEPDNPVARRLLGHRRVNGFWRSDQEVKEAGRSARKKVAGWKKWAPEIAPLCRRLDDSDQRKSERAQSILRAIKDPAAIPAMETKLASHSENAALAMVDALGEMAANEAAVALARQAIFSPTDSVREAAIQRLKKRDPESFVPASLSAMSTPIIAKAELYTTPTGRLGYRQTFSREGQYSGEKVVLESEQMATGRKPNPRGTMTQRDPGATAERELATLTAGANWAVAARNATIGEVNDRVCGLLAEVTGKELESDPESWWSWWNDYNEVYIEGSKPIVEKRGTGVITPPPPPMKDCLVAGTPVWTDSGLVSIEQIQVGDRVLSQDPDSGRLDYKPVLRTTLRPASQLIRIVYEGGLLQSSGGHPLWVCGEGWVKARDVKEGSYLHSAEGAVKVLSAYPAGTEETYNLIVADHHTFFVTAAVILNHDNTIRRPTNAVVPGLENH